MLEIILREIIAGSRQTPHHLEHGARLDYNAQSQQLTITRLNRAPDEREMSIFKAYIKRVGFRISTSAPAEIDPGVNSWVGHTLQLVKLDQPAPAAKQESLF